MKQQTLYNLHHFFLRPVAEALAYAHKKGIIHCDFKPSNVFIMDDEQVKVIDFGIARAVEAEGRCRDRRDRFRCRITSGPEPTLR